MRVKQRMYYVLVMNPTGTYLELFWSVKEVRKFTKELSPDSKYIVISGVEKTHLSSGGDEQ